MKSIGKQSAFQERFKGRLNLINRQGSLPQTLLPIEKPRLKYNADHFRSQIQLRLLKLSFNEEYTPGRKLEDIWKQKYKLPKLKNHLKRTPHSISHLQRYASLGDNFEHRDVKLYGEKSVSEVNRKYKKLMVKLPTLSKREQYDSIGCKYFSVSNKKTKNHCFKIDRYKLLLQKIIKQKKEVTSMKKPLEEELSRRVESNNN